MKSVILSLLILTSYPNATCMMAGNTLDSRQAGKSKTIDSWQAGKSVSLSVVKAYGIERCFLSTEIPDDVFIHRMRGKTYKTGCTIPRSSLRYLKLLHYNIKGEIMLGEMVCHKDIANDLVEIFRKLFDAKYPIERMTLIDDYNADDIASMEANNTSCFNFRTVAGSKTLSKHSMGRAIDINPLYNPYVKRRKNGTLHVSPESGRPYAQRSKSFIYKISKNDICYRLFTQHGFKWGGNWHTMQDYQHFEK